MTPVRTTKAPAWMWSGTISLTTSPSQPVGRGLQHARTSPTLPTTPDTMVTRPQ
ncbi:MAG: hypothetical protein KIT69_02470 [Propionibacteriaceae bacterium]|nr:hypothetical protein [Propionibacteriaceae bacterium]